MLRHRYLQWLVLLLGCLGISSILRPQTDSGRSAFAKVRHSPLAQAELLIGSLRSNSLLDRTRRNLEGKNKSDCFGRKVFVCQKNGLTLAVEERHHAPERR